MINARENGQFEDQMREMSDNRSISKSFICPLYLLVGLGAIVVAMGHLQFSTNGICCGDLDGYYHIKWSQLLWQHLRSGHMTPPQFTWLPLTTLNPADYVDQHFFFHVLQIPFTWFRQGKGSRSHYPRSLRLALRLRTRRLRE